MTLAKHNIEGELLDVREIAKRAGMTESQVYARLARKQNTWAEIKADRRGKHGANHPWRHGRLTIPEGSDTPLQNPYYRIFMR